MNKIIGIVVVLFFYVGTMAQTTYFPSKKGMVMEYISKDAKGKVKGYSRTTIKDIVGAIGNQTVTLEVQAFNAAKNSEGQPFNFQVTILEDKIVFDPKAMFPGMTDVSMEITGTGNMIPKSISVGQTWPDAEATMSINMGFSKMSSVVKMTERKVLSKETITVAAGTYECFKVQQVVIVTAPMGKPVKQKQITWYADGIGQVKMEIYDENNQLTSIEELNSIQ